ncbi:MAG: tRNA (adenosine(37)-N6)-dimethylallyltransferase MiaA [Anaeromicrobium sp.]|jgi:tRNA dimethylallyltransferase|uniref:tRNA (adenosine(37)-N6)-dimethylallyltransferase MiaA n=1 Tax=Anaeromicrobium sp. TaxID=1929132 RepID=UPI0025EB4D60|nr:tRNA (adenosine(37)-N6)-dimethylallyltransferase MiaA [Anaeromicrobium sp.]MCT4594720.1 tRNA (adenosine(37)-N6)-dimethylallyltransferase MiaA [Anaeromicrobium sp.]
MKKPLIIIVGPTAVGKTETSIEIARELNCEIISADSMQIYKGMDIGSAKPTMEERQGIPHFLMDEIDPRENYSVSDFQKSAKKYIDEIISRGKIPMIVGGTGLYVNSIIYNIDFSSTSQNKELREKLEAEAREFGNEYVHNKLKEVDDKAAKRIHANNLKRVIRALEVYYESGDKIKEFKSNLVPNEEYDYCLIGLIRDREELYNRINERVDILMEMGLVDEVKKLMKLDLDVDNISMKGLGYKEIIKYLKGEYTLQKAVDILKRDTRRYAKRQITWFKRYDQMQWFDINKYDGKEDLKEDIVKYIEGKLELM